LSNPVAVTQALWPDQAIEQAARGSNQDRAGRASLAIIDINRCSAIGRPENLILDGEMPCATVANSGSVACSAVWQLRSSLSMSTTGRESGGRAVYADRPHCETTSMPGRRSADSIA
jgi:hypothetical protein